MKNRLTLTGNADILHPSTTATRSEHQAQQETIMVAAKTAKSRTKKRPKKSTTVDIDNPIDPKKSYTSEQLCKALGIERTTLWRYRKQGLQSVEKGARHFYLGKDVQRFLFGDTAV